MGSVKVAIWGAGDVGRMVSYRFATLEFVSEIAWINRTRKNVESRRIDIDQGLAFAPACRSIIAYGQEQAQEVLRDVDILILTHGQPVPDGGTREKLYPDNAAIFRESVLPALPGFKGILIVVSNPLELLCRLVHLEAGMDSSRIIGLGTVVETARMQTCLRDYVTGASSSHDIQAFAVGTHDKYFVPFIPNHFFAGDKLEPTVLAAAREMVKGAVAQAATRVKRDNISTLHPIVEGVVAVARAIAHDTHAVLTVSCLDPQDPDKLFYALPCVVGKNGVFTRYAQVLEGEAVLLQELQEGIKAMRATLKAAT